MLALAGPTITITSSFAGYWIEFSGTEVVLPAAADGPLNTSSAVEIIQAGATPFVITPAPGVTVLYPPSMTLESRYQGGGVVIKKLGTDLYRVLGALADAP